MNDSYICPHCGGFMMYVYSEDISICDCCCYIVRPDGMGDFSAMEDEDMEVDKNV